MKSGDSFCVLPWTHLATHPHGGVSLCCRVDYTDGTGMAFNRHLENRNFLNLNSNSLDEIINSDSFKEARLQMLKGEWPKACLGCKKEEVSGLKSKRLRENEFFDFKTEEAVQNTTEDGSIHPEFQYLELRLGNLCNLKCRTCNPYSSSKWTQEYSWLEERLDFIRRYDKGAVFNWAEDENFWQTVFDSSKKLKLLFINGGEPTLIKQHWNYLEKLIEGGFSKNIDIKYNINMTILPPKANEIWKQYNSVFIGASVDDLKERNTYIRHGASWDAIEENLLKIKSWGIPIAIEQTVSAMNVYYLDEVEKYAEQIGVGYGLNFVYDPDYLAADVLPPELKNFVLQKLKNSGYSQRWFQHVEAHLSARPPSYLWNQFLAYTEKLDQLRNEKFEKTFSDFYGLMRFYRNDTYAE